MPCKHVAALTFSAEDYMEPQVTTSGWSSESGLSSTGPFSASMLDWFQMRHGRGGMHTAGGHQLASIRERIQMSHDHCRHRTWTTHQRLAGRLVVQHSKQARSFRFRRETRSEIHTCVIMCACCGYGSK